MKTRLKIFAGVLKQTVWDWFGDRASSMAAAIAFYTIFSFVPLMLLAMGIAALAFGKESGAQQVRRQVTRYVGEHAAQLVGNAVEASAQSGNGGLAVVTGAAILFFGATAIFSQLQQSLNVIWKVQEPPHVHRQLLGVLRRRIMALLMVLVFGAISFASLFLSSAWGALRRSYLSGVLIGWHLGKAYNLAVSAVLMFLLLATVYKLLPDAKIRWRDVWIGAAATAVMLVVGEILIGLYLSQAQIGTAYGAAGSLVVLLVWVYYSAMIFLLGAEFTHAYATRQGIGSRE